MNIGRSLKIFALSLIAVAAGPLVAQETVKEGFEAGLIGWSFNNGPEFPGAMGQLKHAKDAAHSGEAGARLEYDFTQGGAYVAMYWDLPTPKNVALVEFWIRKTADLGLTFRAMDQGGQTCQKTLNFGRDSWEKVRIRMDHWDSSYGGPADNELRQPVRGIGILAESRDLSEDERKGVIDVDDVTIICGASSQESHPNLFEYEVFQWPGGMAIEGISKSDEVRWQSIGDTSLFGEPREIRLAFRDVTVPVVVSLQCSSHFEGFSREVGVLQVKTDEQWIVVPAPPEGWSYFGGENDGKLHGPIRLGQVGCKGEEAGAAGRAVLTQVTCVTKMDPSRSVVVIPVHQTQEGPSRIEARLFNVLPGSVKGRLIVTLRDEESRPVREDEIQVEIPGRGQPISVPIQPASGSFPCLDLLLKFCSEDGAIQSVPVSAGWAEARLSAGSSQMTPQSPWGMGLYLYRYSSSDEGLKTMHRAAEMAQSAGVKWSREEIQWHRTEPDKGRFDFAFYDKLLVCAQEHGISVYGLLAYWSSWTQPYTEQGVEDYCRWVQEVVSRYKDRVHHWEIWNEPNIFFWDGPKELYPVLLTRAYQTIKSVDPSAQVLGCSTAGVDTAFIKRCMDAGAPFDIVTVHPYRGKLDDKKFIEELQKTREFAGGREVWITEMGWPTHIGGMSELEQAKLLSRCYLCSAASGAAPNMSWYDFREDGNDPFYNEHHFGAVRNDLTPKPAYLALATVCNTLGTVKTAKPLKAPEGWLAYRFESEDKPSCVAIWSSKAGGSLLLGGIRPGQKAVSFIGRDIEIVPVGDVAHISAPPAAPVFLPDAGESLQILGVPLCLEPLNQTVQVGESAHFVLRVKAIEEKPLKGQVSLDLPKALRGAPGRAKAKRGQESRVPLVIESVPDADEGVTPFACQMETPWGTLRACATVTIAPSVIEE